MKIRRDRSIQSSNVPTPGNTAKVDNNKVYRCLVTKVTLANSVDNWTSNSKSPRVLYDVVIIGGFEGGQPISNCRFVSPMSGMGAFFERILKPCTKPLNSTLLSDQDGDIVFVKFVQGQSLYPIIFAVDNAIDNSNNISTDVDGSSLTWLFNGVYLNIDASGILTSSIGYTSKDEPPKITSKSDPNEELTVRTYASGLSITESGKSDSVKITTNGGTIVTVDGQSNKITLDCNGTSVIIDGSTGKISLSGNLIDLGSAVADMVVMYSELASTFSTHTHLVPQSPSGVTASAPPVTPLMPTAASTSVKVQS